MATSAADGSPPLVSLSGVDKRYRIGAGEFAALAGVDLTVERGEYLAIVGPSGSGKSTLLAVMAGIDRPSAGQVVIGGTAVHSLSERQLSIWRGRAVGIVFQFFQLVPTLTAVENVMLPMDFCGTWGPTERKPRALELLTKLGVADQANKLPATLSGGQQQRVAVARAMANAPTILLADEPTGNLDSRTARGLLELLAGLGAEGQTVIMVTHEREALGYASRTVTLADGRVLSDERRPGA